MKAPLSDHVARSVYISVPVGELVTISALNSAKTHTHEYTHTHLTTALSGLHPSMNFRLGSKESLYRFQRCPAAARTDGKGRQAGSEPAPQISAPSGQVTRAKFAAAPSEHARVASQTSGRTPLDATQNAAGLHHSSVSRGGEQKARHEGARRLPLGKEGRPTERCSRNPHGRCPREETLPAPPLVIPP